MRLVALSICVLLAGSHGCSLINGSNAEQPVARVFEEYLYPSDLVDAIPEGTSREDSTVLAKRYVDTWIKDQLMVRRAEQALTEEQKDFNRQIAEYHRSLLIFTYREKLLQQKLDSTITDEAIRDYYEENISNFLLSQDVIRGTYVKLPLSAPRQQDVRSWSRSNEPEDLNKLEKYCITYAEKFDDFNETWIYFSSISSQIPMTISRPSAYLSYNRNIETTDDTYRYFLHISDHLPEGKAAPLEMVAEDIASIILNKRKIQFFRDLERRVYNDGVSRNQFEIYQ